MKKRRLLSLGLTIAILLGSFGNIASADALNEQENNTSMTITPRAEIIGYKYKELNGKRFKRLWSYTYGYWIDAAWTQV